VPFTKVMEHVAQGFEAFGVGVLLLGLLWSVALAVRVWSANGGRAAYLALRETFGRRRAHPAERTRARPDRADPDFPELLAAAGDRGHAALASSRHEWRRHHRSSDAQAQ
jgi:hypothetical protein